MSRLSRLKQVVEDNVVDVETLVELLELTIEDVLERFPDVLLDNAYKFGVDDVEQDAEDAGVDETEEEGYVHSWDAD